jgi:two-component system, LytTR family, response regulator
MSNDSLIRCMVVDDEPLAVDLLAGYIQKTPGLQLVLKTTHVLDALHQVQDGKADLLFLDIQMPELTGIQFMKIMRNACQVILITAYSEFALAGYEHDVTDYLLKPVTFDRFMIAVEKAKRRWQPVSGATLTSKPADHIFIKSEYRLQRVELSAILYIEALRDYIAIHTSNGKILSLESMRNMEDNLPDTFIRIHKSYIINKDHIEYLERSKVVINKQYLPVGDTYRENFMAKLKIV